MRRQPRFVPLVLRLRATLIGIACGMVVRRVRRFMSFGHTPGIMKLPEERITREYPFTLDLRQA